MQVHILHNMHLAAFLFLTASCLCLVNAAKPREQSYANEGVSCTFDLDLCGWEQNTTNKYDWIRQAYGDERKFTGPSADHTTGQGSYLVVKPHYPAHNEFRSEISYKFFTPIAKGCLSLYYHMYNIYHGYLTVRLNRNQQFIKRKSGRDDWKLWTIPITSQTNMITISGGAESGEIAIDDIAYSSICPKAPKCWYPEVPAYSHITPDKLEYNGGEIVSYRCTNGVKPSGDYSNITCMNNGMWSGVVPTCLGEGVAAVCGTLPQAPNTELITNITTKPGESARHRCSDGYAAEFQTPCQCLNTGRWNQQCATNIRCRKRPDPPLDVTISSNNPICFELQWKNPVNNDMPITRYQTRCGNSTSYSSQEWQTFRSTGYSTCGGSEHWPYQEWKCDVKSISGSISSSIVTTAAIRTPCDDPTSPVNLTFGTPKQVTSKGKVVWSYRVTWQAPEKINCKSLDPNHSYDVHDSISSEKTTINQPEISSLLVDGNTRITVTVSARNDGGFISRPASSTITTPLLRLPQPPEGLKITSLNSSCLTLHWTSSDDSNVFQHRCNNTTWRALKATSAMHCGLQPNSYVTCDVRSVKGPAHSDSTSLTLQTPCAAPSTPRNIQVSPAYAISNDMFRYTIAWQSPLEINCDNLDPYLVVYPTMTSQGTRVSKTNLTIVVGWNENISVSVFAQSKNGSLKSQPATVKFTTPQRAKTVVGPTTEVKPISCPNDDYYVIVDQQTRKGNFKLDLPGGGSYQLSLPAGNYPLEIVTGKGVNCGNISLHIISDGDTPAYRMEFNIRYRVACADIDKSSLASTTFYDSASQNSILLKSICGGDCVLTGNYSRECSADSMTVRYGTMSIFNKTVTEVPQAIRDKVQKRLIAKGPFLPVVILNRVPPILYPVRNQDGSSASLILSPFCKNGKNYDEKNDICR